MKTLFTLSLMLGCFNLWACQIYLKPATIGVSEPLVLNPVYISAVVPAIIGIAKTEVWLNDGRSIGVHETSSEVSKKIDDCKLNKATSP